MKKGGGAPGKEPSTLQKKLNRLGLQRREDLLLHLPLRYEDETRLTPIADVPPGGTAQVEGEVIAAEVRFRPRRQLVVCLADGSGELMLRFLNFYPNQQAALQPGNRVRCFGEVRQGFDGLEMVHPRFRKVEADQPLPDVLTPIYPTTAGLAQSALTKLIGKALDGPPLPEILDADFLRQRGLPTLWEALQVLHRPGVEESLSTLSSRSHPAWFRVKLDELLAQQLSLRLAYQKRREVGAPRLKGSGKLSKGLQGALPFALTQAQLRVIGEISADLACAFPMQRLLQGDVGSGKTLVAAMAACQAMEAGWQVAFMAPTEILAEQHYVKLKGWLERLGVSVAWLTGSLKAKAKREQVEMARQAGLVVGTHALIQDGVDFERLGLVIIDEQHRFGVQQRLTLRQKGGAPHQLMMSATPIPRTLAMSYYADLDVSVLDEMPPGRTPVRTRLVRDERRDEVMEYVRRKVAEGRQVYWVCPLIEESEVLDLQTALDTHAWLSEALPELRVGLTHGRLKPQEKQAAMGAFTAGEVDLLVTTTVIEVGVDVPNASVMVIEHAERFGLSQLHQLRGRVGRGVHESSCILMYAEPLSSTARERLKIIFKHTDGFEIARQDLQLRGPGEFVGSRQSGVPLLRYADLEEDIEWVELARDLAEALLRDAPGRVATHLNCWLGGKADLLKA
ncbi:MAG: ATP-dependent DNA helicase RecG [Azovibrio sp.]